MDIAIKEFIESNIELVDNQDYYKLISLADKILNRKGCETLQTIFQKELNINLWLVAQDYIKDEMDRLLNAFTSLRYFSKYNQIELHELLDICCMGRDHLFSARIVDIRDIIKNDNNLKLKYNITYSSNGFIIYKFCF